MKKQQKQLRKKDEAKVEKTTATTEKVADEKTTEATEKKDEAKVEKTTATTEKVADEKNNRSN